MACLSSVHSQKKNFSNEKRFQGSLQMHIIPEDQFKNIVDKVSIVDKAILVAPFTTRLQLV